MMKTRVSLCARKGDFHYAHVGICFVDIFVVVKVKLALQTLAQFGIFGFARVSDRHCRAVHCMRSVTQSNIGTNGNISHEFVAEFTQYVHFSVNVHGMQVTNRQLVVGTRRQTHFHHMPEVFVHYLQSTFKVICFHTTPLRQSAEPPLAKLQKRPKQVRPNSQTAKHLRYPHYTTTQNTSQYKNKSIKSLIYLKIKISYTKLLHRVINIYCKLSQNKKIART